MVVVDLPATTGTACAPVDYRCARNEAKEILKSFVCILFAQKSIFAPGNTLSSIVLPV